MTFRSFPTKKDKEKARNNLGALIGIGVLGILGTRVATVPAPTRFLRTAGKIIEMKIGIDASGKYGS